MTKIIISGLAVTMTAAGVWLKYAITPVMISYMAGRTVGRIQGRRSLR